MYLIVDSYSVLGQFLHLKDEEYGVDIQFEGNKFHIPDIQTCIERAEEHFQFVIDKLDIDPTKIIFVKDPEGPGAARKRIFPEYKAGRAKRPKQYYEVFNGLIDHMSNFVMTSGGICATPRVVPSVEGDDLVYELCKRLPETTVWSTDKDMLAFPANRHYIGGEIDPVKFPVPNDLIVLYRAIVTGDKSDNIPSAKGFGEKAWEELLSLVGPDGIYELKRMVEEERLHELAEDVADFPKLQKIIDSADSVYLAYKLMSPQHIPAHKIKWEARCQECTKELVTKDNFSEVFREVKRLINIYDHSVIDYETDVPPESREWCKQTVNDDGKGGVAVDVIASEITGMGLKIGNSTWYFSVDHKDTNNISLSDLESILQLIKDKRCYAHNSTGFENVVTFNTYGYFLEGMLDTRLMASYVNENDYMGLKHLSKRDLEYEQETYQQIIGDRSGMREVTGEEVLSYGIDDVITCDALQNLYTVIMQYEGTYDAFLEYDYESAFVTSLAFAEGVGFDAEEHKKQQAENFENIERSSEELDAMLVASGFGEDVVYNELPGLITKSSIAKLFQAVTGKEMKCSARTVKSVTSWLREEGFLEIADAVSKGVDAMNELYRKHWKPRANLNVRSSKQIQDLMYNHLGLPVRIRNKTTDIMRKKGVKEGSPASNEEAMMNAIAFGDVDGDGKAILEKLIEYKGYLTKESLFFSKYPKFVHWKTGRIHSSMTQCGATTRRFTHTPNLAQLPSKKGKEVRNMIKALDGYSILANDLDSQELKLQAEDSKCKEFVSCYIGDVKKDVHALTGYQVAIMQGAEVGSYEEFEAKKDGEMKPFRALGKGTNFSTSYLCMADRLAHMLGVPKEMAQSFIDAKAKAFPGLMPHIEKYIEICRKRKYSVSFGGARRHLAKMYAMAKNDYETGKVDRLAWSYRIQGSGCEQIKLAMARAWRSGVYKDRKAIPLTVVHDEFVNQVRNDVIQEIVPAITNIVKDNYADMVIPAGTTPKVGRNFGSLSKFELANLT